MREKGSFFVVVSLPQTHTPVCSLQLLIALVVYVFLYPPIRTLPSILIIITIRITFVVNINNELGPDLDIVLLQWCKIQNRATNGKPLLRYGLCDTF